MSASVVMRARVLAAGTGAQSAVRRRSRGERARLGLPAASPRARVMRWWSVAPSLSPASRLNLVGLCAVLQMAGAG
jgi:hypothetical protein